MTAVFFYALYRVTGHSAKGDLYFAHFPNVAGIKAGSVVTYEGFEVGNVTLVEPVARAGRTVYRVALNLRQPVKIPADSRAVIAAPGLLSAPVVEIREGCSREVLAAGGDIPGGGSVNLMESVATLAAELSQITEASIKPMLAQFNQNVTPAMADVRLVMERINRTARRVDELFSEENVSHWSSLLRNADGASASAMQLSNDLSGVRADIEALVGDVSQIVNSGGKDLEGSLRRVDATLYQLEAASRNLNEFSRTIRENPAALISRRPPVDDAGAPQ
jgi:phospholipid/cholesterol/gamma-HCH transport system substrate-binding protein